MNESFSIIHMLEGLHVLVGYFIHWVIAIMLNIKGEWEDNADGVH